MEKNLLIDFKILALLTAEQAHKYGVIPFEVENGNMTLIAAKGAEVNRMDLEMILGKKIKIEQKEDKDFSRLLGKFYPWNQKNQTRAKAELREESDVIRFVRRVMDEAINMNASDIHIERYETYARIRYRWEGQLIEKYDIPTVQYNAVVSRIKILSELDISERRLPQDGRINVDSNGSKFDIRVSIIPGKFGEKVVMRLLARSKDFLQLENLGMHSDELTRFTESLQNPNGIILITGPTGSGKTTTLYAALSQLNIPDVNISTIEDPIEYNIEGINQVQVKEDIGLTFGHALRSFLRQDPDIIMVGEIRDQETAEIAIRAALTGHLVFSTLHTNSAWDAVIRLADMGVEPYLIAASLRLVAAQRLLRVLCENCRASSEEILFPKVQMNYKLQSHFVPVGCSHCHYTGFSGRKAVYEVIPITKELSEKIKNMNSNIDDWMIENKVEGIKDHVLKMVKSGETSLSEALTYLVN